jgi:transcriptional regulator with XRE-family HTH domain
VAGVAALPSNSLEFVGMIWELMTKLDLSQTALGAQCGLSQQQLSRW